MTSPHKTKALVDGQEVEQTYHEALFPFDKEQVTGIKVIAFDHEGKILGVKRGRTFDIPSGCQEWDDDTFEEATRREVYEQASAVLDKIALAAVIENAPLGTDDPTTFTLVMTGFVKALEPMLLGRDHKRTFLDKKTFLNRYRFGNPDDLKHLIDMAEFYAEPVRPKRRGRPPKKQACEGKVG